MILAEVLSIFFITTFFIWLNANYDANLWLLELRINHVKRAIIRFIILGALPYLLHDLNDWLYYVLFFNLCAYFWILFDLMIQGFIHQHIFRIGKTAWTDRFLRYITSFWKEESTKEYYAFVFKLILLFSGILVYLMYY